MSSFQMSPILANVFEKCLKLIYSYTSTYNIVGLCKGMDGSHLFYNFTVIAKNS